MEDMVESSDSEGSLSCVTCLGNSLSASVNPTPISGAYAWLQAAGAGFLVGLEGFPRSLLGKGSSSSCLGTLTLLYQS